MTCDNDNQASIAVIEGNGGALEAVRSVRAGRPPKRYYWIEVA